MDKVQSGNRTINISDEVLCKVAALAAADVEGVAKLAPKKNRKDSVQIENIGGAISVCVRLIVKNGYRAMTVAKQVQLAVKHGIQDMTGVTAVHVNVEISAIEFEA